ncbi:MAG: hypothetical protein QGG84_09740 [Rhodospirillales bacterium]|jgi:hypothetical protein|nr:hypothetical protein [Rhodospirillales bacterium]
MSDNLDIDMVARLIEAAKAAGENSLAAYLTENRSEISSLAEAVRKARDSGQAAAEKLSPFIYSIY